MARYLSLDWIDELAQAVSRAADLGDAAQGRQFGVTQVVNGGPEGDVTYHLQVDGTATFGPGPADPEHIRFVQDWDTAVAVATGTMNAQEAFIKGLILLYGDVQVVVDHQPVFAALAAVFDAVRPSTDYR